jgi:hypothetical protein
MIVQKIERAVLFEFKSLPIVMLDNKSIYHIVKRKYIAKKLNCRSFGYWIDRRFYTHFKLNKLATKVNYKIVIDEKIDCPF